MCDQQLVYEKDVWNKLFNLFIINEKLGVYVAKNNLVC